MSVGGAAAATTSKLQKEIRLFAYDGAMPCQLLDLPGGVEKMQDAVLQVFRENLLLLRGGADRHRRQRCHLRSFGGESGRSDSGLSEVKSEAGDAEDGKNELCR